MPVIAFHVKLAYTYIQDVRVASGRRVAVVLNKSADATMKQRRFIQRLYMERAVSTDDLLALMAEKGGNAASTRVFEGTRWLSRQAASEVIDYLLNAPRN